MKASNFFVLDEVSALEPLLLELAASPKGDSNGFDALESPVDGFVRLELLSRFFFDFSFSLAFSSSLAALAARA